MWLCDAGFTMLTLAPIIPARLYIGFLAHYEYDSLTAHMPTRDQNWVIPITV